MISLHSTPFYLQKNEQAPGSGDSNAEESGEGLTIDLVACVMGNTYALWELVK